jgi:hypothetical protein
MCLECFWLQECKFTLGDCNKRSCRRSLCGTSLSVDARVFGEWVVVWDCSVSFWNGNKLPSWIDPPDTLQYLYAADMLLFYTAQWINYTKSCIFFKDVLPYITWGPYYGEIVTPTSEVVPVMLVQTKYIFGTLNKHLNHISSHSIQWFYIWMMRTDSETQWAYICIHFTSIVQRMYSKRNYFGRSTLCI